MKQLTKYILIISLITIVSFFFLIIVEVILKPNVYDSPGSLKALRDGLLIFIIFILPFITVFMSGFYQVRNPSGKGYLKSLLIPLLFTISSIVGILVYFIVGDLKGEDNMIFGILWIPSIAITFIAIAVINLIIFGIMYIKNK